MTVRKKILDPQPKADTIALSSQLQKVREALTQLPPDDEGANEMETATDTTTAPKTPRKVTKKPAKKVAKKPAKAVTNGEAGTTLATIAKSLKMEPRKARRILRTADGVPDAGSRWTWTKAGDVAKVKSILEKATKDE